MKNLVLVTVALFVSLASFAQQDAQYSHYMFNTLVVNPAYAGSKEVVNLSGLYRKQWVNIEGSPTSQTVSIDGPVANNNVGLALQMTNDQLGARHRRGIMATYAYRFRVAQDARLSFGLSGGIAQFGFDANKIRTLINENVASTETALLPDANFGIYYQDSKFYAGISVNDLFAKVIKPSDFDKTLVGDRGLHYFATAGYLITVSEDIKIKPSLLLKADFTDIDQRSTAPTEFDFNAFVLLRDRLWIGASLRTAAPHKGESFVPESMIGLVEFYVNDQFRVGYSYDYTLTELGQFNSGSHEVSLGYFFKTQDTKDTRMLTPRYF